jgi:hypothetical protein
MGEFRDPVERVLTHLKIVAALLALLSILTLFAIL